MQTRLKPNRPTRSLPPRRRLLRRNPRKKQIKMGELRLSQRIASLKRQPM
jgi:hypothetical protein